MPPDGTTAPLAAAAAVAAATEEGVAADVDADADAEVEVEEEERGAIRARTIPDALIRGREAVPPMDATELDATGVDVFEAEWDVTSEGAV
jgi:hypothetical protein